jgi:S1-C subfamily serine protease
VTAKEPIVYVGNPFDKSLYETLGFVANELSSVTGLDIEYRIINTDIFITSCTNGFMYNLEGEIVGVVANYGNNNQTVKGILISDVNYIIQRMLVEEKLLYVGIYGEAITDEIREISGINMPDGVYVTNVEKDSPAYLAGIRTGDIITKVGYNKILSMLDIKRYLQISKINDKLNIVVNRYEGNKYNDYTISVTVGEREYAY